MTAETEKDRGAERTAVAAETPEVLDLAQPYAFELRARVVDADGLPFGGGYVALAPPGCALGLSEPMDGEGRVTVKWRARAKELTMAVGFAFLGKHTSLQQVTVVAGVPAEVSFVAFEGPRLFEVRGAMRAGLHPDAVFGDRLAIAPPDPKGNWWDGVTFGHAGTAGSALSTPRFPRVDGRLFRADGQPATGVVVQLIRKGGRFGWRTDAEGRYRLVAPAGEGPLVLRAGGGPEGTTTRDIELTGNRTVVPDLILETGRTLRGCVRRSTGAGLNGARVEYVADPGHDGDVATVGPDGTFAFANLPPGAGRLLVWGADGERFPIAEEPSALPDSGDVEIDLRQRAPANGELRVFVRGHDGETPQDIEVRCWQQQTRRGAFLDRRQDGAFHAHGMMAGFYRVEVGALATGFRDLGVHWVDGNGMADLGTVLLGQPARLHLETESNLDGLEAYAVRADIDVRADEIAPWTRDVLLPPGRWLLLWKRDGQLVRRELELTAGATTTLRDVR